MRNITVIISASLFTELACGLQLKKKNSLMPCLLLLTSLDQEPVIKFAWPKD